ncbi:hypothetical protein F5Y11DRAFT_142999 [Daldinia sp. FL1419]|nr:hypothetical protein F5Y11DRAFT_142999 [Daldinia sp. FL1419]
MPSRPSLRQLTRLYTLSRSLPNFHHFHLLPPERSISTTPSPQAQVRIARNRNTFIQPRFTEADIPPIDFWKQHLVPPFIPAGTITPAECLEACKQYVPLATSGKSNWAKTHLTKSPNPPPGKISLFALHYAATLLFLFAQRTPGNRFLAMHILFTATMLGYAPSILTLGRMVYKGGGKGGDIHQPEYEYVKEGLEALVAAPNRSPEFRPDALTLAALMQIKRNAPGNIARAAKLLEDAEKTYVAAGGKAVWTWRGSAALALSKIYLDQKQPRRAREVLAAAAKESDDPVVCFRYAMMLEKSDPERSRLIQRAAVSGVEEAAREMAEEMAAGSKEEGLGAWERKVRELMAEEWRRIAGEKATV